MPNPWPLVPLGHAASPVERLMTPVPGVVFRQVGVKLWGQGAYERESIDGAETKYKSLSRVEAGDIIVNKIWARNGSVAVIPETLAGAYVSGEFPTFVPVPGELDPRWFHWFTKTPHCWEQCDEKSRGTSGKNRIRPELFLEIKVPLPPPDEQRRIVARIEQLAAKIEEAHDLRRDLVNEVEAFLASASEAVFKPQTGWTEARVIEFCEQPQYGYTASAVAEPVGPRLLRITDIQDGKVNWDTVPFCQCDQPEKYLLRDDDLVFARTGATTGKSFVIRACPNAVFASYLIRLRVQRLVTVQYLYLYFQTPSYWSQITDEKKGTGQPNVNGRRLANIRVPIAPPGEQRRIVAYLENLQAKVDALKKSQAETAAELGALVPSILDRAFRGEL